MILTYLSGHLKSSIHHTISSHKDVFS